MTPKSEDRLSKVHSLLRTKVHALATNLLPLGITIEVVQGLRTFAEQDALFAQGRTTPGKRVTNARGGQSNHNYGLACFDEQTEILTERGWCRFSALDELDSVMTFKDGVLRYELPRGYVHYPYRGEMVSIQTRSVDLLVTPNHKCVVQNRHLKESGIEYDQNWQEVEAANLTSYCRIPTAGVWDGNDSTPSYPLKSKVDPETWWAFMGWYLSEGSSCGTSDGLRRSHSGRNKVRISQGDASDYLGEIESLLESFPFRAKRSGHDFVIDLKELWSVTHPLGNSHNKRMPRYLLDAPRSLLKVLFQSLLKGDGTLYQGHEVFWTVNKALADDFSELCVKLGVSHVVTERAPRDSIISSTGQIIVGINPQYAVSTRRRATQELRNGSGDSRISRELYDGMVYCVTTDAGAVVVRRSGKVAISGNCDVCSFKDGQPQWNDEHGFQLIGVEAKKLGLEWGGSWVHLIDEPHVQLPGLSIHECFALYRQGGLPTVWASPKLPVA